MGKSEQDLEASRLARAGAKSLYGLIPRSVMKADWTIKTMRDGQRRAVQAEHDSQYAGGAFGTSARAKAHQSDFPHNLCRFFVKWLTPERLEAPGPFRNYRPTVIDPFAGHNSRMEDVWACGRNYIGYDLSAAFMEKNRAIRDRLLGKTGGRLVLPDDPEIRLVEGDSRGIRVSSVMDFAITSPPFWDTEYYGPELGQLGKRPYTEFLDELQTVFLNVFMALKEGGFFVVESNDLRRDGHLIPFHADILRILLGAGFILHDMVICDFTRGYRSNYPVELEAHKHVSKEHSYFAVVRKGEFKKLGSEAARERLVAAAPEEPKGQERMA